MDKTLPKGHLSCLSNAFRYTPASHTDLVKTFARVRGELTRQQQQATPYLRALPRPKTGGQTN